MRHKVQAWPLGDEALLKDLGERLARRRLELGWTQTQLAEAAGLSRSTVERLESGHSVQLLGFLRLLRALGLLADWGAWLPEAGPGPMALLKGKGKPRQRARPSQKAAPAPWRWGDEG